MSRTPAYIGLGSNLEDPRRQVSRALQELGWLPQSRLIRASRLYLSPAVGPRNQPDYVNAVAAMETDLEPLALLHALFRIEAAHRRVRQERWGPRTLDLDLLLYGDRHLETPELTLPHPRMGGRAFVLLPLAEIAPPKLVLPGLGHLNDLLHHCKMDDVVPL